ncbi:MAG: phosphoribosylanthranilate isomerase [Planctomycetota bacterium]
MSYVRTRIKICGVRTPEIAAVAAECGADMIGLNFVPSSPRFVEPKRAVELMFALPPGVTTVGVVRDLSVEAFCDLEETCPCQVFQLHGAETEETVRACGPDVIRAVRFDAETAGADLARWGAIDEVAAILIDGSEGGDGTALDWARLAEILERLENDKPVLLAGGLTPDNVADAIRAVRPYAVDVASGVEHERGVKDAALIRAFCEAVRSADAGG